MRTATFLGICMAALLAISVAHFQLQSGLGEESMMQPGPNPSTIPWPIVKSVTLLGRFLEMLPNWVLPRGPQLLHLALTAQIKAQTIKALAVLGVADLLGSGPKTAQELADASGYSASGLYRLLRLSTSSGVFAVDGPVRDLRTRFRNNNLSVLLRSDHPESIRHLLWSFANDFDPAWTQLIDGVKTGQEPFKLHYGTDIWQYYKERPENEKMFSQAMAFQERSSTYLKDYQWDLADRVVDIGGAYGSFLAALMYAFPHLNGTLFDMPQVIDNAASVWTKEHANLSDRASLVGGDFFDSQTIPQYNEGRTVYIMRSILHDWSDDASVSILKAMARALKGTQSKLVINEVVLNDQFTGEMTFKLASDLQMMTLCSGKERTTNEWEALLSGGGFKLNQINMGKSLQSVIEAEVA